MKFRTLIGNTFVLAGLLATTLGYAGVDLADGHGGYCTDFGTPTAERPQCTQSQHDAAYKKDPRNPADEYLARKDQALRIRADWFLHQSGMRPLKCERVLAVVGGDLDEPFIAAIMCENTSGRVLYEVLNHAYSADEHGHARVATPAQIDADIDTIGKGLGIAGTWWKQ